MPNWVKLFTTRDEELLPEINAAYDQAFRKMHGRAIIPGDEDIDVERTEASLTKLLQKHLKNEDLLNEWHYQQFYNAVQSWQPNYPREAEQAKSLAIKDILLEILPDIREEQLKLEIKRNYLACENYLKYLDENPKNIPAKLLKEVRDVVVSLKNIVDPNNSKSDHQKKREFEGCLQENKEKLFSQSKDSGFIVFVKALGVAAAAVLGLGVGGVYAYQRLFKQEIVKKDLLRGLNKLGADPDAPTGEGKQKPPQGRV